jgi:hypothetical protein
VYIFFISIGGSWNSISVNIAVLETFKSKELDSWLQVCHGAFGVGGLLGPYIVYLFELNTYYILGVCGLVLCPLYFCFTSPETQEHKELYQHLKDKE